MTHPFDKQTAEPLIDYPGRPTPPSLNELFSLLGSDPEQNIRTIVEQTCKLLQSASSMYNRLDEESATMVCWAGYQLPPDFPPQKISRGYICYEALLKQGRQPVIFEDLSESEYCQSDPYLHQYGIKSYLGYPVHCEGHTIAMLCVLDTRVRRFSQTDIDTVAALAKAIALEEKTAGHGHGPAGKRKEISRSVQDVAAFDG